MKRTVGSGDSPPSSPRSDPTQRRREPDGTTSQPSRSGKAGLVSFNGTQTLAGALAAHAKNHPGDAQVQAAVDLIAMLERADDVPDADSATIQAAVDFLLDEAQGDLLRRLAEKTPDHVFVLRVGDSPAKAQALADIGADWPSEATVHLSLSTALPAPLVEALHPFVQQPETLGVKVLAMPTQDAATCADVLLLRPLEWLEITGSSASLEWLQALAGVEVDQLCLSLHPPEEAQLEDFVLALVAIVKASGAEELHIEKSAMDGPTCARLLACRNEVEHVNVRLCPEVMALLVQGQHTIGCLEVQIADETPQTALAFMGLVASPAFMKVLHVCGVGTLVVHGPVDMVQWVEEMDRYASLHPMPTEYVDAGFVTLAGVDPEEALVSLERNDRIVAVTQLPLSVSVSGYSPLDAAAVKRLEALSTAHAKAQEEAVSLSEKKQIQHVTSGPAFTEAVNALAALLGKASTLRDLIAYIALSHHVAFTPVTVAMKPPIDLTDTGPRLKLEIVRVAKLPEGLVRAVVSQRLSDHPQEKTLLLRALMDTQLLGKPLALDEGRILGLPLKKEWVLDGGMLDDNFPQVYRKPPVPLPAESGTVVHMPADPQARWALVAPYTHAGYDAFVQTLQDRIEQLRPALENIPAGEEASRAQDFTRVNALFRIRQLLVTGVLQPTVLDAHVCAHIAIDLLALGQGKLLRHMLPAGATWQFDIGKAEHATALAELHPWPAPQRACRLGFHPALPHGSLQRVVELAGGVAPDKLKLMLLLADPVEATLRDALVQVIESRPGLTLMLQGSRRNRIPLDGWPPFLQRIQKRDIGHVEFTNVWEINPAMRPALVDFVRGSRASKATVYDCDAAFTQDVVTCKLWDTLSVTTSPALANTFKEKAVSAKTLRLIVSGEEAQQCAEDMIGSCQGLERVEIFSTPINVAALTRGLEKSGSVTSVKAPLAAASYEEERAAAVSLRRNPWLIDIELVPPLARGVAQRLPITDALKLQFERTVLRNLLRDSEAFRMGAGKGFGWSLGDGLALGIGNAPSFVRHSNPFTDMGALMGGMLDVASARALSMINKAAYAASQAVWQMEIERLGDLFAPGVTRVAFVAEVNRRIHDWKLPGEPVVLDAKDEKVPITAREKALILRSAGLHDSVVALVLRRRLTRMLALPDPSALSGRARRAVEQDLDTIHPLLEALAYVGAVPPETWFSKAMGIEVQPLPNPTERHA